MAQFTNQATLSYTGGTVVSNIVTGELLDSLSVTLTALTETYSYGDTVTYVVSIINSGCAAVSVTVRDDMGAYGSGAQTLYPLSYVPGSVRFYSDGVLQPSPAVVAGPPVSFGPVTVPAGGNVILVYSATVNAYAPLAGGSTITNTVTVTGSCITEPLTAQETITAVSAPLLSINKALSPAEVTENSELTYIFTIYNYGSEAAGADADIVISDVFDPVLRSLAVSFNGSALTSPDDYTYNALTGAFATVSGAVTVPAATYTRDSATGAWITQPGVSVLTVTGTV